MEFESEMPACQESGQCEPGDLGQSAAIVLETHVQGVVGCLT